MQQQKKKEKKSWALIFTFKYAKVEKYRDGKKSTVWETGTLKKKKKKKSLLTSMLSGKPQAFGEKNINNNKNSNNSRILVFSVLRGRNMITLQNLTQNIVPSCSMIREIC